MTAKELFHPFGKQYEMPYKNAVALIPRNISGHYLSPEVCRGVDHAPDHPVVVLGLVEQLGKRAIERGAKINLSASRITAIYHDTQRNDDGRDLDHGKRAADYIARLVDEGIIVAERQDIEIARELCNQHNIGIDYISLNGDANLRNFKLADYMARVRFEGREDGPYKGYKVRLDHLQRISGGMHSDSELAAVLNQTRRTTNMINLIKSQRSGTMVNPQDVALGAGLATNLFRL